MNPYSSPNFTLTPLVIDPADAIEAKNPLNSKKAPDATELVTRIGAIVGADVAVFTA